jgi:hypothetical protein
MVLGAAATEQLFMQRLEGTVELELCCQFLSSRAELRGQLTPISEAPLKGVLNHRAFSLLTTADGSPNNTSPRTHARHTAAKEKILPPVPTVRVVSVLAPMHVLSALLFGRGELLLYCRKSRSHTEYFTAMPEQWGGWSACAAGLYREP